MPLLLQQHTPTEPRSGFELGTVAPVQTAEADQNLHERVKDLLSYQQLRSQDQIPEEPATAWRSEVELKEGGKPWPAPGTSTFPNPKRLILACQQQRDCIVIRLKVV